VDASLALFDDDAANPPISDFDEEIDALNIWASCEVEANEITYHNTYVCAFVTHVFVMLQDFSLISNRHVIEHPKLLEKGPKDNLMIPHTIQLASQHLLYGFEGTLNRLCALNTKAMDSPIMVRIVLMLWRYPVL
jgi:hypothetical protein